MTDQHNDTPETNTEQAEWRQHFPDSTLRAGNASMSMSLRIFGVLATIVALIWGFLGKPFDGPDLMGMIVLIGMITVAAGSLGLSILLHFRQLRYGDSTLRLDPFPLTPGEWMKARFEVGATIEAPTMTIQLRCVDTADPDYHKINIVDSKALWETEVDAPIEHPGRYQSQVCFEMLIPRNARCKTGFGFMRGIVWQLRLRARTSGVNFQQEFVLPVIANEPTDDLMNALSQPFNH